MRNHRVRLALHVEPRILINAWQFEDHAQGIKHRRSAATKSFAMDGDVISWIIVMVISLEILLIAPLLC